MKHLLKTASWLLISGFLIFLSSWYESGLFMVGLKAAVWASLFKTPIYWVHEWMWHTPSPKVNPEVALSVLEEAAQSA